MGFVPFGQNLQLQSGVPLAKVGSVFAEKLTITKRLEGGGAGSLLASVLSSGSLSSVMQNPMAALTGGIQGQVPGLVSQLQGMVGGGPTALISALSGAGGLSDAIGALKASGDNLAGLTNGATGYFAMIGHANTVAMAGDALPPPAAMEVVTRPLEAADVLEEILDALPGLIADVVASDATAAEATAWVLTKIALLTMIVDDSAAALAWSEANHALIATVASVAGALAVPPSFDEAGNRVEGEASAFQGLLASIVKPGPRAAMAAGLEAAIAHTKPVRVDVAAMSSLED